MTTVALQEAKHQELMDFYRTLDKGVRVMAEDRAAGIKSKVRFGIASMIDAGNILLEVKEALPHGVWGKWLELEFSWTDRTAQNFMNMARSFKSETVSDLNIGVSALQLLAAPSVPEVAREEAIARAQQGEEITKSEAKAIIAATKRDPEPAATPQWPDIDCRVLVRYLLDKEPLRGTEYDTIHAWNCPFCHEKSSNGDLTVSKDVWRCYHCDRAGSHVSFARFWSKLVLGRPDDDKHALKILQSAVDFSNIPPSVPVTEPLPLDPEPTPEEVEEWIEHQGAPDPEPDAASLAADSRELDEDESGDTEVPDPPKMLKDVEDILDLIGALSSLLDMINVAPHQVEHAINPAYIEQYRKKFTALRRPIKDYAVEMVADLLVDA